MHVWWCATCACVPSATTAERTSREHRRILCSAYRLSSSFRIPLPALFVTLACPLYISGHNNPKIEEHDRHVRDRYGIFFRPARSLLSHHSPSEDVRCRFAY
ncbi:unnamed protein product [Ectocarpus sp. 12 AP-2014]